LAPELAAPRVGAWRRLYWVRVNRDELRALLMPSLELPIERVVVSHGEPVLSGGAEALRRCLSNH
jgi:hypothetical protein